MFLLIRLDTYAGDENLFTLNDSSMGDVIINLLVDDSCFLPP